MLSWGIASSLALLFEAGLKTLIVSEERSFIICILSAESGTSAELGVSCVLFFDFVEQLLFHFEDLHVSLMHPLIGVVREVLRVFVIEFFPSVLGYFS